MSRDIAARFHVDGEVTYCARYGSGHINETYLVRTRSGRGYILQKLNRTAFQDIPALMQNVVAVTQYMAARDPDPRHSLHLVPTQEGANWLRDAEGGCWRMYDFVTDSICLDRAATPEDFRQSARGFGGFQQKLADFPAAALHETIPHFHDTPERYRLLHEAMESDPLGRRAQVGPELDFALAREADAGELMCMLASGKLPLRVTHNDTKLNNVLLDATTREALCVIDLDTVMPGLIAFDFGDSIRFGAATADEDETELDRMSLSLPLYEIFAKNFVDTCGAALTEAELLSLPAGARLMTLECGVRFLTDYLNGDIYFHIARPRHNLDRARTQFRLVENMENKWQQMHDIIGQLHG